MAASRCFDGFRIEGLGASPIKNPALVDVSFDYPVKSENASAFVVNTKLDISKTALAFVLNAAIAHNFRVSLCLSKDEDIKMIEEAVKNGTKADRPRQELTIKSIDFLTIPYTRY